MLIFIGIACDGNSRINGVLRDKEGKPVAEATIRFEVVEKGDPKESYEDFLKTDGKGVFHTSLMHAPFSGVRLRLTVFKEGFKASVIEFTSDEARRKLDANEGFDIILEKEFS